ncbi:penicillin acylase family protein [Lysobacter solisilvae (ex Woo and Kim 2020)]|uniref:Penicillin acylase family protein n=1 Tax=Agrilutibacter terrestris TaxID=2865112 RepID=A0A7H0FW53_9GAMM|nr:penicillin acylase family protein [Lysobacter terrestris]QNP40269.1 penicillin acylase family protein [Lysobacter terrestris]
MLKWIRRGLLALLLVLVVLALAAWWLLRGSLPQLEGELSLAGLSAPVSIQRDALGVVTIEADNPSDAMRALGYVHAQERYFEMDLLRRTAAGELAELFGPIAVGVDKQHRVHRFRARVEADLDAVIGTHRPEMQAYVDGVNAGLGDLKVRPWPYLLLRTQPEPWQLSDSPLVAYAMYFDLQDGENARELALWKMRPHLPPALFKLITHDGSRWDAPLTGRSRGDAVPPTAQEVDLRRLPHPEQAGDAQPMPRVIGSNNFAVSGELTRDGRAIVADDMHLGLRAPNLWFRAQLRYRDPRAPDGRVDIGGFTLPGFPFTVVGSNGHVAWAFTNSYVDTLDWAVQDVCGAQPTAACVPSVHHREQIAVAGSDPVDFDIEETAWGPVLAHDARGRALALRWVAHLPGSLNLNLVEMARARTLADAVEVARRSAIPAQNMLIADSQGAIGWRWLGPIPVRAAGCDPSQPIESTALCPPWPVSTTRAPLLLPTRGRLWTANNRVVGDDLLALAGDGGSTLGARARQIRDDLDAKAQLTERDLLAVQLDDRAVFMRPWWQLLRDEATRSRQPALGELARAATAWQGRASIDSVSYRITRAWRRAVTDRVLDGLTGPAQVALGDDFVMPGLQQQEGFVWPLVTQRPTHLLSPRYADWNALFEDAAREVRDELQQQGPLAERTWGEQNTAKICHPLARALPGFVRGNLCMPFEPLPGDVAMPRVQAPDFGASERMVVAPGHEADGIIHMPGGQSGHPLSPFWGSGHDDWVHGRPTPFLPGATQYTLRMAPPK